MVKLLQKKKTGQKRLRSKLCNFKTCSAAYRFDFQQIQQHAAWMSHYKTSICA